MLTKKELMEKVFEEYEFKGKVTKQNVKDIIDATFESIIEIMASGEDLDIYHFGRFTKRTMDARPSRNPKTGEKVMAAAKAFPVFKASQKMKDSVKGLVK